MKTFNDENFVNYDEAVNYLGDADHVDELLEEPLYYFFKHKMLVPAEDFTKTQDQFVFNGFIKISKQDSVEALYGQNIEQAPIENFKLSEYGTVNGDKNNHDKEKEFKIKNNGTNECGIKERQYYKNNIYFKQITVEKWAEDHGIRTGVFEILKPEKDERTGRWRLAFDYHCENLEILYTILEKYFFDEDDKPIYEKEKWIEKIEIEKKYKEQNTSSKFPQKLFDSINKIITDGDRIGGKKKKVVDQK